MFSQTVEYGLRAMTVLAQAAPEARATSEIARAAKVPSAYLVKILQQLNRSGLVKSQKGVRGGVSLSRPPEDITILEIVNAVDPIPRIRACPLGLASHQRQLCGLHARMDQALATVEAAFAGTTLKEVLGPTGPKPACPFPRLKRS